MDYLGTSWMDWLGIKGSSTQGSVFASKKVVAHAFVPNLMWELSSSNATFLIAKNWSQTGPDFILHMLRHGRLLLCVCKQTWSIAYWKYMVRHEEENQTTSTTQPQTVKQLKSCVYCTKYCEKIQGIQRHLSLCGATVWYCDLLAVRWHFMRNCYATVINTV